MTTVDFTTGTDSGHRSTDTHTGDAAVGTADFPGGHSGCDTHSALAAGEHNPPAPATEYAASKNLPPVLAPTLWADSNAPLLALLADVLDDLQRTRIANENRLRQLTRTEADSDGEERGFGLTLDQPQVAALADVVDALGKLEHASTLNLQRAIRKHPLGPWVKATTGVGEKQGARLIAAIGDPYWNTLHNRPRTVSELWAYCGLHVLPAAQCRPETHRWRGGGDQTHPGHGIPVAQGGPAGVIKQGDPGHTHADTHTRSAGVAPTRTRGQRANWSAVAKSRAWLIAESCKKQRGPACRDLDGKHADDCTCSPYRILYDSGRAKYADATHPELCRRCGPKGTPVAAGSPLSAGHQEARALRLVSKEILKDLWRESKRIHEATQ